jgi:hypothetical protein
MRIGAQRSIRSSYAVSVRFHRTKQALPSERHSMPNPLLERDRFAKLPHWATVAFVARCGRRRLPLYENDISEPRERRVPVDFLENTELPLPPLAEQKRIVAKIEDLLTRARKARESLSNTTLALKRFHQSVLDAACTGRLTEDWRTEHTNVENARHIVETIKRSHEALGHGHGGRAAEPTEDVHTLSEGDLPDTWTVLELMWLCEPGCPITYGILKPGPNLQNGIPYIRVADFPNDQLSVSGIRRTSEKIAHEYRRSVQAIFSFQFEAPSAELVVFRKH